MNLGHSLAKVEIGLKGDDSAGRTDFSGPEPPQLVDRLAICFAGEEAESIFNAPLSPRARWGDRYKADKLVEGLSEDEALARKREGRVRASQILKANEKEVIQLAEDLIENGRADYAAST